MDTREIIAVKAFVDAINRGDCTKMARLMTEDHTFVNSVGEAESGRNGIIMRWQSYFRMFPDYRMNVRDILGKGNLVAVFGTASGTYNGRRGLAPENWIEMPTAWKAVVENGKVKHWQVYADWTEGQRIIEEDEKKG